MQSSNLPARIVKPFASGAGAGFIRTIPLASQIGVQDGAASYNDGFPPLNFQPIGSGGVPPFGQDMNGIFFALSAWAWWQSAGGVVTYDAGYAASIGGYPKSAVLASTTLGGFWQSTAENNTTDPDAGGAGWAPVVPVKATAAQLKAASNDTAYATAKGIGDAGFKYIVASSLVENGGYEVRSDGLIKCWGKVVISPNQTVTVTLPYPHTSWVNPSGNGLYPSTATDHPTGIVGIVGSPPTGFQITNAVNTGPVTFYWNTRGK